MLWLSKGEQEVVLQEFPEIENIMQPGLARILKFYCGTSDKLATWKDMWRFLGVKL